MLLIYPLPYNGDVLYIYTVYIYIYMYKRHTTTNLASVCDISVIYVLLRFDQLNCVRILYRQVVCPQIQLKSVLWRNALSLTLLCVIKT